MLLTLAITASVFAPANAQVTAPGQPAQAVEQQRRAELRKLLQQKQATDAQHRQLSVQERADLREALRKGRATPVRDAGAKP